MRIAEFLRKENLVASFKDDDKDTVLRELCALLAANGDVSDGNAVFDAVMKREKLGSTGIGDEVAMPHAKTSLAKSLTGAFGVSRDGIAYFAIDDKPVKLVFLLVAAENSAGTHLKALARISRLLRSVSFRERVKNARTADEMYSMITEEDEKLG